MSYVRISSFLGNVCYYSIQKENCQHLFSNFLILVAKNRILCFNSVESHCLSAGAARRRCFGTVNYQINLGAWNSVFAVPTELVDRHLKLAGAVQLKVLLWTLRHSGEPVDEQVLSQALGIPRADAADAMLYWQECGLVAKAEGEGQGLQPPPRQTAVPAPQEASAGPAAAPAPAPQAQEEKPVRLPLRPQKPDNAFVAQRVAESQDIAFLMQEAQVILGRLINNGDSATLLMMHDYLGLPIDVILMLLQYTVSVGKANTRYIEKVAMNWADEEINTHEKAEEKIRSLNERTRAWGTVEQTLGIAHRSPTKQETELAARWVLEWRFSPDMIREAYERCVNQTGKLSMKYMNRILERWQKEGIFTLRQAQQEKEEKAAAARRDQESRVSYDIDSFERSGAFDSFHR